MWSCAAAPRRSNDTTKDEAEPQKQDGLFCFGTETNSSVMLHLQQGFELNANVSMCSKTVDVELKMFILDKENHTYSYL